MKLFALLLLLANIVLVALDFERRLNAPPPPRELPAFEGRVRLQLVDELEQLPPLRDAGVKPALPAPPPPLFGPDGTLTADTFAGAGVPGAAVTAPTPPADGTTYAMTDGIAATAVDPALLAAIDGSAPLEPSVAPGFEGSGEGAPATAAGTDAAPAAFADYPAMPAEPTQPAVPDGSPATVADATAVTPVPDSGMAAAPGAAPAASDAATAAEAPAAGTGAPGVDAAATADAATPVTGAPAATFAAAPASASSPDVAPEVPSTDAGTAAGPTACLRYGPFAAAPAADAFQRRLAQRGVKHKRFVQDGEPRKLFWVYLEPSSKDEAQIAIDALAKAGVKDYLLIKRAGIENAISLGVFSSQESVNRRLAEMSERGYQPLVVPRYEPQKTHWVDVAGNDPAALRALGDEADEKAPGAALDCGRLGLGQ